MRSAIIILALVCTPMISAQVESTDNLPPFHFAFSSRMFLEINENDGKASLKVWAEIVARERGVAVDAATSVFNGLPALKVGLTNGSIDGAAMTADEYFPASERVKFSPIFATTVNGDPNEEYLLLVHRDSKFEDLASLRGANLLYYENAVMCLSIPWLETVFASQGLPSVTNFFRTETAKPKISATVLPVFFRTTDACLVNRRAFETLVELNPQVGRKLRVLATSPQLMAIIIGFRADRPTAHTDNVHKAFSHLHDSVAGKQILTVFRIDKLELVPESALEPARQVWEQYQRLHEHVSSAPVGNSTLTLNRP
jgi:ABC-type phosphate/phosphonate transport system substrate-binding protein